MRTTLDIDDHLLEEIVKKTNARSKKKAVENALAEYLIIKKREELANLVGNYQDFDLSLKELEDMRNDS
ncbi:MAG: type II toxin-antitoxin system VapB family antitoxin [Calditrichaeota bacterium]|nr:type II toxin-antitoxin system VapB family antitoxin [Calditrichota bacterium]